MKTAMAPESALLWSKSSYSGAEGGQCVEVAESPGAVHVRDSKQLDGPLLTVGTRAWASFLRLAAN
ncbi:DUF397 domain-containing protein [[Kitasatospora] papulosa]|uniref:DUF397 domain-containing protein n=2 Tax=[Kitasatospora] papulosa TaxID=1464011 RepID=UPI0036656978